MIFKVFASLWLVQLVAAQYGAPPPSTGTTTGAPASAPSVPPNSAGQWNIEVNPMGNTYVFSQPSINASVGDKVTWYFTDLALTHSVTQSSFKEPCTPLAASGNSSGGFDSTLTSGTTFTITIQSNSTIWYHCKQLLHCGMGMVGSINPPTSGNTHDNFVAAAKAIGQSEPQESDSGTPILTGVGAVATAGPVTATGGGSSGSSSSGALRHAVEAGWYLVTALVVVSML